MIKLVGINREGNPQASVKSMPPEAGFVGQAYKELYATQDFLPPWIGYYAEENGALVGTCGFKCAPRGNRVEIAYFTFPKYEGRGIATQMAKDLIEMAKKTQADIVVFAQTRPEENASTAVLKKLGFKKLGEVQNPQDGLVWEWELEN